MQGSVYQRLIVAVILAAGCALGLFHSACIKFIVVPFVIGSLYTLRSCLVHYDEKEEDHSFIGDFKNMFYFYDDFY